MRNHLHTAYQIFQLRLGKISAKRRLLFLSASAFLFFMTAMFSMVYLRQAEEALSARIAPEVLRFHVLANSDSSADQELKLEVKQMLIDTIYQDLKKLSTVESSGTEAAFTKETMTKYICDNSVTLEKKAEAFMAAKGFSYSASVKIESCYFPTKIYGDVVFPCGTYDAVRVLLGKGDGKNWWCVLYPPLCFTDNATAVVPDASKKELEYLLDDTDFHSLMKNRRVVFGDKDIKDKENGVKKRITVRVRSRFFDLVNESVDVYK